jgi:Protein of unknown function (DUF3047)
MLMNQQSIRWSSLLVAALSTAEPMDLLGLQSFRSGGELPPAWKAVAVRGQRAPTLMLQDSVGLRFLRVVGTRTAGWFVNRLSSQVPPSSTRLAVSWRVLTAPAGADLRAADSDDAALRVFVVFDAHGRFQRTPRTLFYSTGTNEPTGYSRSSFQSRALHVIRIGSQAASSTWLETDLDPFADYRRVWGGRLPAIVAVGLMQDTDQTGSAAMADVRMLSWTGPTMPAAPRSDPPPAWTMRPGLLHQPAVEPPAERPGAR